MTARVQSVTRQGALLGGPSRAMTTAEAAVLPLLQPYAASGTGFLLTIDKMPPRSFNADQPFSYTAKPGVYNQDFTPTAQGGGADYAGTPTDTEVSGFKLRDRVGARILVPLGIGHPHPEVVQDTSTGKPCLAFGAGGHNVNILTSTASGAVRPLSLLDWRTGAETNDTAFFSADMASSCFGKFRCAAPNGTVNGATYGATVGGSILSGASDANSFNNNYSVFLHETSGFFEVRNRFGNSGWTSAVDFRDGALHTFVAVYDPVADRYSVSIDGGGFVTANSSIGVIGTDAAALKLTVGALGTAYPGGNRACMCIHALGFIPSTILLTDSGALAKVMALLAEK